MADVSGHTKLVKGKRGAVWFIKYRYPSGKQKQDRLGPAWTERSKPPQGYINKKMAKEALESKLTDIRRGEAPDPGRSTGKRFGDAVAEWLRYVEVDKARKASTLRDYTSTVNSALLAEFSEDAPLAEITDERIDAYRRRMLAEEKLTRRTIQKRLVLLNGILKRAAALKWIPRNPAELVEKVNLAPRGEFNVLTALQVGEVASMAEAPFDAAIIVAAYTGLRTGELRALRWRDVSLQRATIHVQRNAPVGGEHGTPKSGKGRSTPLMIDAARALDALSQREHFTGPDDLVFCGAGGMLSEDALRDALYDAMEAAGLDRKAFPAHGGFWFHDLRHTFGTLGAAIWPLHDLQAYMGHSSITTTMLYAHHVPKVDAAAQFSEYVERQKGSTHGERFGNDLQGADLVRA